jgi:multimeric flavodoxin WrbA
MFNINAGSFDINKSPTCRWVVIGSPDYYGYVAGCLKMFIDDYHIADEHINLKNLRNKPLVVFLHAWWRRQGKGSNEPPL